jgi:hypothetical protein
VDRLGLGHARGCASPLAWPTLPADARTGTKLLLLHEAKADDPIRHFLHEAWEAYVKVLLNPFYEPGGQVRSPAFDAKVKASARKHL